MIGNRCSLALVVTAAVMSGVGPGSAMGDDRGSAGGLAQVPSQGAAAGSQPGRVSARRQAGPDWRSQWIEVPQWGGRVGYIDDEGRLKVTLRYDVDAPWVVVAEDVADFQLLDWRLGVLKTDGTLWINQGKLNEPLRQLDSDVAAFQLTLTRTGILGRDGTLRIYEWGYKPYAVAHNVAASQTTSDGRVGFIDGTGDLWVQEGGAVRPDAFQKVASEVDAFQFEREWLVTRSRGELRCSKDGRGAQREFVTIAKDVADFEAQVEVEMRTFGSRLHVAAADRSGRLLYGEGDRAALTLEPQVGVEASSVHWAGGLLAISTAAGTTLATVTAGGQVQVESKLSERAVTMNAEGALLLGRGDRLAFYDGSLSPANARPSSRDGSGAAASTAIPMRQESTWSSASIEAHMAADFVSDAVDGGVVAMSSLRPAHTRRPVESPVVSSTSKGLKVVFEEAANPSLEGVEEDGADRTVAIDLP